MIIPETDLRNIESIVANYCKKQGLAPKGYTLNISLTLEPTFQIVAATSTPTALLKENPLLLWRKEMDNTPFYGVRIGSVLDSKELDTMYKLVTLRGHEILRQHNCGKKCLAVLSDWLKKHGLHFGMHFPDEIAKQFDAPYTEPVLGLAALIAQNLDD